MVIGKELVFYRNIFAQGGLEWSGMLEVEFASLIHCILSSENSYSQKKVCEINPLLINPA